LEGTKNLQLKIGKSENKQTKKYLENGLKNEKNHAEKSGMNVKKNVNVCCANVVRKTEPVINFTNHEHT